MVFPKGKKRIPEAEALNIIIDSLRETPFQNRKELGKSTSIPKSSLKRYIRNLKEKKKIQSTVRPKKEGVGVEDIYYLHLSAKDALILFRKNFLGLRWPTPEEISHFIGKTPEETRKEIYKIAPDLGWEPPERRDIKLTDITLFLFLIYSPHKSDLDKVELVKGVPTRNLYFSPEEVKRMPKQLAKSLKYDSSKKPYIEAVIPIEPAFVKNYKIGKWSKMKLNKKKFNELKEKIMLDTLIYYINKIFPKQEDKDLYRKWLDGQLAKDERVVAKQANVSSSYNVIEKKFVNDLIKTLSSEATCV